MKFKVLLIITCSDIKYTSKNKQKSAVHSIYTLGFYFIMIEAAFLVN